jgi:hypothetical protein
MVWLTGTCIDVDAVGGGAVHVEEEVGAQGKDADAHEHGDDRPGQFQGDVAVNGGGPVGVGSPAILDGEIDDDRDDGEGEEHGQSRQQQVEGVHLPGKGGGLFGEQVVPLIGHRSSSS